MTLQISIIYQLGDLDLMLAAPYFVNIIVQGCQSEAIKPVTATCYVARDHTQVYLESGSRGIILRGCKFKE